MPESRRVAVIGATGQGDYGHGLDTAFVGVEGAEIVAVADPHEGGLAKALQRLPGAKGFADYRKMLAEVRPDVVCVGPRWLTDRVEMLSAVAAAGCHIYCEKPFAADLVSADAIADACRGAKITLAMAHQWRTAAPVAQILTQIRAGKFGRLLRMVARPKDDARGGGEELLVHGTHLFDMMLAAAGAPLWVSGHVQTGRRDVTRDDLRAGTEPVGPVAGDSISAMFGFADGVRGYFESTAGLSIERTRPFDHVYGLSFECEKALVQLRQPGDVFIYPAPAVLPDIESLKFEKLWIENWHFTPEHQPRPLSKEWLGLGNRALARDLLDAIARNRPPLSPLEHALWITEMVQGVYASHLADGVRLPIPLERRRHPLAPA